MTDRRRVTRLAAELARLANGKDEALPADFERWTDERLATAPPHRWPMIVAGDSRFHHRLIARHLMLRAMGELADSGNMRGALRMSETASTILDILAVANPDDASLAIMRAEAMVDRATYLTWLGRYGVALDTIESGEMLIATILTPDAELARARLLFARAIVYSDPDVCRYDDALALLDRAGDAFRILDQTARRLAVERVKAVVLMALNRPGPARALIMSLLGPTEAIADPREHARLLHQLATCAMQMGDTAEALRYGELARTKHRNLGDIAVDIGRADWTIGRALELTGDYASAAEALNRAAEAFARADMLDLWVRVRLDYVHVALLIDPDADVRILCESIAATSIALDNKEANRRRQCTAEALDYLRRIAMRQALTLDTVAFVRAYLDDIAIRPVRRFMPSEPEQTM